MTSVTPSAARLTESLRDVGYNFATAIADLVDNSIAACATRVDIWIEFAGANSRVFVGDDGIGMTDSGLIEALRFGTRRPYRQGELGRYGLGLKTASLSQCRRISVVTRHARKQRRIAVQQLDLDRIIRTDHFFVVDPGPTDAVVRATDFLESGPGTVVIWEALDRVLPEGQPDGGWARRRLESLVSKTLDHLGMVFHRFLDGTATRSPLSISINGEKVASWDPFAPNEPARVTLPVQRFELAVGDSAGSVVLRRTVLPSRSRFSSPAEFDRMSGPLKWNRQQGLYVYRADRLIHWGGWNGLRALDEHTKLGRASLDFGTELDQVFNVNVAKMRVNIPAQLRQMLGRPIHELCAEAESAYRVSGAPAHNSSASPHGGRALYDGCALGLALRSAAMLAGEYDSLMRIVETLRGSSPDVAQHLGLN